MNWPKARFIEVCDIQGGTQPPKSNFLYEPQEGYVRLLQIQDFNNDNKAVYVPDKKSLKKCKGDDILIGRYGASIGRILSGKSGAYNVAIVKTNPDPKLLEKKYLFHYLRSNIFQNFIANVGGRAAQAGFNKSDLERLKIPLPPLSEQKRIAAILDQADAIRRKREESLQLADAFLRSVFLDMFGDPVTNPKGWRIVPLIEILSEKSVNGAYYPKGNYSDDGGVRMVHMADAFYGKVDLEFVKRVNVPVGDVEKYAIHSTDLLVSRRSLNYEGSAKPCLIPVSEEPLIFESSLIRLRPNLHKILTIYLFHYLQNERARSKYVFPLVTRSTISGINQSNLMKVLVILPPLDLQHRFAAIVESVEQQKARIREQLAEAEGLFASLQQRAFKGEL